MKELEELQKKAEELAAGLEQVNKQIEELKNLPTGFDKLPENRVCLVQSKETNHIRLAVKKNNLVKVINAVSLDDIYGYRFGPHKFNELYTFIKVVDLS